MPDTLDSGRRGSPRPAPVRMRRAPLAGAVLASVTGIVMVLTGDFGGWYWHEDLQGHYGYVHMFNDGRMFVALAAVCACLAVAGAAAVEHLGWLRVRVPPRLAFRGALVAVVLSVVAAVVFFALAAENDEVWLDTAFFGAFLGGSVTAALLWFSGILDAGLEP